VRPYSLSLISELKPLMPRGKWRVSEGEPSGTCLRNM
jgi:hypothetical protein